MSSGSMILSIGRVRGGERAKVSLSKRTKLVLLIGVHVMVFSMTVLIFGSKRALEIYVIASGIIGFVSYVIWYSLQVERTINKQWGKSLKSSSGSTRRF